MFNAAGYTKVYNGPGQTQGEFNGMYAAVTQNDVSPSLAPFDPNSDSADTSMPAISADGTPTVYYNDPTVYGPAPDAPSNSGGGFDIGGFLAGINNLGSAIVATSRNVAADVRQTRANISGMNQPATFMDTFNSMPMFEKLAIGIAAFFVLRLAVHKL